MVVVLVVLVFMVVVVVVLVGDNCVSDSGLGGSAAVWKTNYGGISILLYQMFQ